MLQTNKQKNLNNNQPNKNIFNIIHIIYFHINQKYNV